MNYAITGNKAGHCYGTTVDTFAAMRAKIAELAAAGYRGIGVRFVVLAS